MQAFGNRNTIRTTLALCTVGLAAGCVNAQQATPRWNQFRGPNGSGVGRGVIPSKLSPEENLLWRTELPSGHSSPVIHQNKVFLTGLDGKSLLTICLDLHDGRELWRREAPRPRQEKIDQRNHPASPSPFVDEQNVFVFFPDFGILAYDLNGKLLWKYPLGPFNNLYGMGASPIVVDDLLILNCDQNLESYLIAWEKTTGRVKWKVPRPEATSGHCTPIVYRPDRESPPQIIVVGSFRLSAYDSATGNRVWWVDGLSFEMKSTPVFHSEKETFFINGFGSPLNQPDQNFQIATFADTCTANDQDGDGRLALSEMPDDLARNFFPAVDLDNDGRLDEREWNYYRASIASKNSVMAIRAGGTGDMTARNTLWKYHRNVPQLPSPLLVGNQLFLISDRGIVTCLDAVAGRERFKGRLSGATGSVYASPITDGKTILFCTTGGKIASVKPGPDLEVLSVCDLGESIFATPAIVNGSLLIRTDQALYRFGNN